MKAGITFCLLLFAIQFTMAQVDPINKEKLAIGGYDLTTYFDLKGPMMGSASYAYLYHDANYYFVSAENKTRFVEHPEKFLPQYEGYCALGISYGKKISIDPLTYKITDGKLYLFYHIKDGPKKVNSMDTWNKNEPKLLKKADDLWPKVAGSKYVSSRGL